MSTTAGKRLRNTGLRLDRGLLHAGFNAEHYGFAFIKSGFEHLQDALTSDFRSYGIDVVGARPVVLNPAVVDYVYRDSRHEPFYPAMFRYLIVRPVIAMALHGEDLNTQATLKDLKCGTNGCPSLRKKYMGPFEPIPDDEIEAWYRGDHPNQDDVTVRLTQRNVFHAADTSDEAVESLRLLSLHNADFWLDTPPDDPRVIKFARYLTASEAELILP